MKISIIDSDGLSLAGKIYQAYPEWKIATKTEAVDPYEWQELQKGQVDVAIICIDLVNIIGLEVMNTLLKAGCEVIISSEWTTFSYEALRAGATDYLLKPYVDEELYDALERTSQRLTGKRLLRGNASKATNIASVNAFPGLLACGESETVEFLPVKRIIRCLRQADGCSLELYNGRTANLACSLIELEKKLSTYCFLRTSQSCLVNLEHVDYFLYETNAFVLKSGQQVRVSKSWQAHVRNRLRNI